MNFINSENIMLIGSILLIAGVLIGKSSYRIGVPILLIFLLVGMGFGVDGLGIHFSDMHTAQFIGMIALCVILFSGGMDTKISAIRPIILPGIILSTIGVALTTLFTGLFIFWLSGQSWTNIHFALLPSLLLAATMSSTDSASVFGILGGRKINLRHNLRPLLELESGSNDPMAYLLTIVLIDTILAGNDSIGWIIAIDLLMQLGIGLLGGYLMGKLTMWLIHFYTGFSQSKSAPTAAMTSILLIGSIFLTFAITTQLNGNGYLAVYICGMIVGNTTLPDRMSISKFMEGMTWLAQIVVFIMLGLLVNPADMLLVAPVSLLIGAFIILLGRPASVFLSLTPIRNLSFASKTFLSWVGLRGAVPIIFATYPVVSGIEGADVIFNIVFFVTLLSLLIQGTTVIAAAKQLKLVSYDHTVDPSEFGVEMSEQAGTSLHTIIITQELLEQSNTLRDLHLPKGALVMMIKRGDKYIVPNGTRRLLYGDVLLIIKETHNE